MPYVGQKPADIISTAVDTVTGKFSGEIDAASLDISGNIDVDGTSNLDIVDIDGAVNIATTALITGVLTTTAVPLFNGGIDIPTVNTFIKGGGHNVIQVDANTTYFYGGTSGVQFRTADNAAENITFSNTGAAVFNEASNDADFRVESNGNAFMLFIDASTDNVCIGTGTVRNAGLLSLDFNSGADGGVGLNDTASNNAAVFIGFLSGGTFRGSITNNNNGAVAYNVNSDYRLKENVSYSFDATTRLKQLKPARFNWIADSDNTAIDGFLAHEVSSIVPEAITGDKDETKTTENVVLDVNENIIGSDVTEADWLKGKQDKTYASNSTWQSTITQKHYQQIDQSKLVPLLTKALQEQQTTIEALTARIVTLENA